jgi:hypothetical protein
MIAKGFASLEEEVKAIFGEHLIVPSFKQVGDLFHGVFNFFLTTSKISVFDGFIKGLNAILLLEMLRFESIGLSGFFLGLDWLLGRLLLWVLGVGVVFKICGNLIHLTYIIAKS